MGFDEVKGGGKNSGRKSERYSFWGASGGGTSCKANGSSGSADSGGKDDADAVSTVNEKIGMYVGDLNASGILFPF